tara:strand:+ start:698 stop:904 length:207 start_codon:yes stop_codon:yes gene_type:complete
MKFKDEFYKKLGKQAIIDKLQLIDEFETKYKPNTHSIAMKKWCTDYEYRKREWAFRQGIANLNERISR